MTDTAVKPVSPAAARTRLMLEGPLMGLGMVTALGLATWGIVQAVAFRLYARLS